MSSQNDAKRAPNVVKTIVGSKTLIVQNSSNVSAKLNVFEGQRVILGAKNQPREAPRREKEAPEEDKESLRRS